MTGLALSDGVVWSRAARRKASKNDSHTLQDTEFSFGVKIVVESLEDRSGSKVTVRWLKGHDTVAYESFCGMLVKKLSDI